MAKILPGASTKVIVSMIENGHVMPTVEMMKALCDAFECKPTDLYPSDSLDLRMLGGDDCCGINRTIRVDCHMYEKIEEAAKVLGYKNMIDWLNEASRAMMASSKKISLLERISDQLSGT